jgi:cyclic pyranopterin phosphate synthase
MEDKFNRNINYARISITDNCNLRCIYCMPEGYTPCSKKIISQQEIKSIVEALSSLGVKRIRLTGGEPLLRQDIIEIMNAINNTDGIEDIGITTNGMLLSKLADKLFASGLKRVNISLDSLKDDTFKKITGGNIENVLQGIEKCVDLGVKVKLNMVPIAGINDGEIADFIKLTENLNVDVRFIELMPIGPGVNYKGVNSDTIKQLLNASEMTKVDNLGGGPSEVYQLNGHKGRIGFISPMSHNFCASCNRIRITSDGKLKPCLHNPRELDLIPYIDDKDKLIEVLHEGIFNKYQKHTMDVDKISKSNRKMVGIGG